MILINQMIRSRRFLEFITELVKLRNEELDEKAQWEFWLHKDFERSFEEFRDAVETSNAADNMNENDMIDIIRQTKNITMSFVPEN